ncbi:MAG: hypothetical protein M0Q51_13780 [Bacteroidales bacterium]|nr:hypothetical protein [Bacteroidales bacterium]
MKRSDLSFKYVNDTLPRLNLAFNRSGNISIHGDMNMVPGINYRTGKLQVIYSGQKDAKPVKLAEAELILN